MIRFRRLLFSILFLCTTWCFAQNDCVYTAGFTRDANGRWYAAYWKSGQLTKLTNGVNNDEARTIAISGGDVHVGGFKMNGGNRVAAYWKNGRETPLNLIGDYSRRPSEVYAIKTAGSDVYMFVTQPNRLNYNDPNNYYYYYKNGSRQTMTLTAGQSVNDGLVRNESFFVGRNGDIYIVNPTAIGGKITYWRNGNRVEGSTDYSQLERLDLNSIFVTDAGDVYIAGTKVTKSGCKAAYWKNGNEVAISIDPWNTYASGIWVENGSVYISGYETRTFSHFSALYWKDGYKTRLHDYDKDNYDASTRAVAAAYGTVYIAGSHKGLVYWVNGKEVKSDQGSGEVYAMTIVKGGGCFNNTQVSTVTTPNYQSSSSTSQVRPQQQQPLSEDVRQLAVGVSGLIASIRADKERRLAEEKQAALEKSIADRQRRTDADNGVYKAQIEMAEKYFSESKYDLAESLYLKAFENPNASNDERDQVVDKLMCTLALQEKKKEFFDIYNYLQTNNKKNYFAAGMLTMLKMHCSDFGADYMNCSDSITQQGVNELKRYLSLEVGQKALYAYLQVMGTHEKFGIPKDEKQGLKTLESIIDEKYSSYKPNAYYYLGMIYLNGTATIKVNEKKALNHFKKGYLGKEKDYHLAPFYSVYAAKNVYFNYDLLNYIKIAILYSKSEDQADSELGQKMLKAFNKYYKGMIPNSDKAYFNRI